MADIPKKKKVRWSTAWDEAKQLIWARRWRLALGLGLMLVNTVAVPLYYSRGLHLTSILYVGFWINALVAQEKNIVGDYNAMVATYNSKYKP